MQKDVAIFKELSAQLKPAIKYALRKVKDQGYSVKEISVDITKAHKYEN